MATIPRTYLTTSKDNLSNIQPKNGQVIAIYDSDEVWYDAPDDGNPSGNPIRRKISGVRVVSVLPDDPMEGIVYVNIGGEETLPSGEPKYTIQVWVNGNPDGSWYLVGSNQADTNVETVVSDDKFYLVGSADATTTIGTLLKNSGIFIQNGKIHGNLEGNAASASNATKAEDATYSVYDKPDVNSGIPPKKVNSYIHEASSTANSGTAFTFTRGDGSTFKVYASDTTYDLYTNVPSGAGVVPGTNTTVDSDSTGLLLTGSGWLDKDGVVVGNATTADKDNANQVIKETYIKALAYDDLTDKLTITKGDGSTSTVDLPTTNTVFSQGEDGLVPGPVAIDTTQFLRSDAQWASIPTFAGANPGLVPTGGSANANKFLKGNGTWGGTFVVGTDGLVPAPTNADVGKILSVNSSGVGEWVVDSDTTNTAGTTQETVAQIAAPLYVVGSTAQTGSDQTYTNSLVFIQGNRLYQSNGAATPSPIEVVDVSSSQNLTNKTFNGSPLGTGAFVTIDSVLDPDDAGYQAANVPTNGAVVNYVASAVGPIVDPLLADFIPATVIAPVYDDTDTSYASGDFCTYNDPLNGTGLYKCNTAIAAPAGDFDPTKWDATTIIDVIKSL